MISEYKDQNYKQTLSTKSPIYLAFLLGICPQIWRPSTLVIHICCRQKGGRDEYGKCLQGLQGEGKSPPKVYIECE